MLLTGITLACLGLATTASAGTAVDDLMVRMQVNATCLVVANPLDFGTILVDDVAPSTTTTVEVTCSSGVPFDIAMDVGSNEAGTGNRQMWDGVGNYITYNINLPDNSGPWGDPGRGDTFPAGNVWNWVGTNTSVAFTVNGSVTSAGPYAPGNYSDLVTVTVNF